MFDFLKKKLKKAVEGVKKKVKSPEPKEKPRTKEKAQKKEKTGATETKKKSRIQVTKERVIGRIAPKISPSDFENVFSDFETALLENNVAQEVVEKIKEDMRKEFVGSDRKRKKTIDQVLKSSLDSVMKEGIFKAPTKRPVVCMFIGVNGVGKTTSMAKFAHFLAKKNLSSVFAASDTFRAASIEQLEKHGNNLGIKVIKHDYGADAAAVAFDSIEYAKKHGIDFVLIDTAGRMHSNRNLMDELKKIKRVAKPDFVFFVGDSLTGNDAINQAKTFEEEIGFDGIILAKSDVDQKGGAIISVSYVTGKPVYFLGMGQGYSDLKPFSKKEILKKII
jgi:fused signal recognition particle receptor